MGFGLSISENLIENKNDQDWIVDRGIYYNKRQLAAKKAWETRREKNKKMNYSNREKKNKIREELSNILKNSTNILTLETEEYLLPKLLPESKFYIAEKNKIRINKMIKEKPDNVTFFYGDISTLCNISKRFDAIYLDFCCTLEKAIPRIIPLLNKIDEASIIGFSFCLRKNKKKNKNIKHFECDIINTLQKLINNKITLIYEKTYRDKHHAPMTTLIFNNEQKLSLKTIHTNNFEIDDEGIIIWESKFCKWFIKTINKKYPYILNPLQLFNPRARTHYVIAHEDIVQDIFFDALNDYKSGVRIPQFAIKDSVFLDNNWRKIYNYYIETLVHSIFRFWDYNLEKNAFGKYSFSYNYEYDAKHGFDKHYVLKKDMINNCAECGKESGIFIVNKKNYCGQCMMYGEHLKECI